MSKYDCMTHQHPYNYVLKIAKNNIFLRSEEAMFVELAKACLPDKKYSVFEKTEPSSPEKKNMRITVYMTS